MNILELKDVCFNTPQNNILNNVNLIIKKSDFITISGPSGSGKSTLLKLLNNLVSPTSGGIFYKGKDIYTINPVELRKEVGLCFQTPHLFGETVFDNLSFPFNIRKADINYDLMRERLHLCNLDYEMLEKSIKNLSGGEKQRIALARTLLFIPEVLLLDEITSALDEDNTHTVEKVITSLNNDGVTILWITHNPLQAKNLGNRHLHVSAGIAQEVY